MQLHPIIASVDALFEQQRSVATELLRPWLRVLSLPAVARAARATEVGKTPHDVVFARGTLKLLRYRRETPAAYAEPILFCYALINRPYILDLQPDKSVVCRYLAQGLDVYMIDWGVPADGDSHLRIEDYVCGFLHEVVDFVLREHKSEQLHLLGYCMGGTFATMFTALYPERVRSLTLLASPIDFADKQSLLSVWSDSKHFDVDAFVDAFGNCPALFLQVCFLCIKPVQNLVEKWITFYEQMTDPRFVTSFFAMEAWVNDNIPVAGEAFREFVKQLYQRNQLMEGELRLGERRVDLGQIACPLLILTAEADHLVPPESTESIRTRVGSQDVEAIRAGAGHVGLVVGGKAQKTIWPYATRWVASRSTATPEAAAAEAPCAPAAVASPASASPRAGTPAAPAAMAR